MRCLVHIGLSRRSSGPFAPLTTPSAAPWKCSASVGWSPRSTGAGVRHRPSPRNAGHFNLPPLPRAAV